MLSVGLVYAYSPLTSIDFYKAYIDIPLVKEAAENREVIPDNDEALTIEESIPEKGKLTPEMMTYLFDDSNPLDIRIALINAIGFVIDGVTYKEFIGYCIDNFSSSRIIISDDKVLKEEDIYKMVSPEQMAILVYLNAMTNTYDSEKNCELAEHAMKLPLTNRQSFVLPMALIMAQRTYDLRRVERLGDILDFYLLTPKIQDMRPEAVRIVKEYADSKKYFEGININVETEE